MPRHQNSGYDGQHAFSIFSHSARIFAFHSPISLALKLDPAQSPKTSNRGLQIAANECTWRTGLPALWRGQQRVRGFKKKGASRSEVGSSGTCNAVLTKRALASGLDGLSNFNRAFRAEFGVNPPNLS